MTLLLMWNTYEKIDVTKKILEWYINNIFNIDEIHYLLELVVHDIIVIDKDLSNSNFYTLCENLKDDYLDYYNDLPAEEIDIDPSNYVLKEEFDFWVREFYKALLKIV